MESSLRVTLVQTHLQWHDPPANRARFEQLLTPLTGTTDLVVLPEMFTTGFTMAASEVAEPVNGPTTRWMQSMAARMQAVVTGSIVTRDGTHYFNRLLWVRPDGSYTFYDKRHLFRMAGEQEHFSVGTKPLIVELQGWRICPLICYDLRFPVWSRNRLDAARGPGALGYDVLLYVANWPQRRRHAWRSLLTARAIENLSYCLGVNRIGNDATGVAHTGDSAAIDFLGEPLTAPSEAEFVTTVALSRDALQAFRRKFPAQLDADEFDLR